MNAMSYIRQSIQHMMHAKLRSFLAMLGIIVGTAAVVTLLSTSELATDHALAQFKSLGTNILSMQIYKNGQADHAHMNRLSMQNVRAIAHATPELMKVAPYSTSYMHAVVGGMSTSVTVVGADAGLRSLLHLQLSRGRFIHRLDKGRLFAVIGSDLAKELNAAGVHRVVGRQIQVGNGYVTVIGVLKPFLSSFFFYADVNKGMVVPLGGSFIMNAHAKISHLLLQFSPGASVSRLRQQLQRQVHHIVPGMQIYFQSPQRIIALVAKQRASFTILLGFIGVIALLVGGIGVMNIMLVSVMERRQEIGIRMAVGARRRDISLLFLAESVGLTMVGGMAGIVIGVGLTWFVGYIAHWAYHFYVLPVFLGWFVSVCTGVCAGFYPAFRAARLNPIDSLHST